jgi:hypothetical protein
VEVKAAVGDVEDVAVGDVDVVDVAVGDVAVGKESAGEIAIEVEPIQSIDSSFSLLFVCRTAEDVEVKVAVRDAAEVGVVAVGDSMGEAIKAIVKVFDW